MTDPNTRLLAAVRRTLAASGAVSAGETLVVALSGGPDSVALADALVHLGRELNVHVVLAHLDHGLRPASAEDARFCIALGESWGVPVRVGRADVRARAAREHAGVEDAARRERYAFLNAVRAEVGGSFIALGHTRDDQAETLLLRLLRGAGSDGLASMRVVSGERLRPLLDVSRAEVLDHLHARGLDWREDESNADLAVLRNRVRHELLPYLESRFNPAVRDALARSAELLADDADAVESIVDSRRAEAVRMDGAFAVVALSAVRSETPALARRVLRRAMEQAGGLQGLSAYHIESIRALAASAAPSGRRVSLPGRREALVSFDQIRIGPASALAGGFAFPLPVPGRVSLPGGLAVTAEPADGPPRALGNGAVIAAPVTGGLTVRTRRPGDRVFVGGRDVSLKRFLMSRRVPATFRGALPLLTSGARVLWIPGVGPTPACNTGACVRVEWGRTA